MPAQEVVLTPLLRIGKDEASSFYLARDIATAPDGDIFVADAQDYSISKFDKNGRLLAKSGSQGEGPGEFTNGPYTIEVVGNRLFSFDTALAQRAPIFDLDLELQETMRMYGGSVTALKKGGFVLSGPPMGETFSDKRLRHFDGRGNFIEAYTLPDLRPNAFMRMAHVLEAPSGELIMPFKYLNRIDVLDAKGRHLRTLQIPKLPKSSKFKKSNIPQLKRKPADPNFPNWDMSLPEVHMFKGAVIDRYGRLFLQHPGFKKKEKTKSHTVFVFDYLQDNLITSFEIAADAVIVHIDDENNLYTRENQNSMVVKYKIDYVGF